MKDLPANFGSSPGQSAHKYFHNICQEFKKTIYSTKGPKALEIEMSKMIDAAKEMTWKEPKHDKFHKAAGEKAVDKVFTEFQRYMSSLRRLHNLPADPSPQDLLDALEEVTRLIKNQQVE
jgi:hypothetical protein